MNERRNCLEKPRKPILPIKTLDILFRRKYVQNTQFYFTNRRHALTPAEVEEMKTFKYVSPFTVPRSETLLSYIKYSDHKEKAVGRERRAQPLHLKDNVRLAATRDISKRMYIEEPPDDVRTVLEIHPEFYRAIEGRPIRCYDDIKVYINNIRKYAMCRQEVGDRRDFIHKLNKNIVEENKQYDAIYEEVKLHIKNFQKFLTEDYKKAVAKVAKAEKIYEELVAKNIEYISYVNRVTAVNNVIFIWDAIRNVLKIYRKFMLFAAPLSWRQQYDESLADRIQSIQFEEGKFEGPDENDLVEVMDIEKLVTEAIKEFKKDYPAHMYFSEPQQMLNLFRTMEMQCRDYLIQLSLRSAPQRMLQERIKKLNASIVSELDYFQYYIDSITKDIEREEYNEKLLQDKFYRILDDIFWESVASPSTLKLKICVEYVYEQIFGKCEEGHQSLRDPMKVLEVYYEEYNLRIDALDFKIVEESRKEMYHQDLIMMRNAYKAERELRSFEIMTEAMKKAFLPPAKFKRPEFKKFMSKKSKMELIRAEQEKAKLARGEKIKAKPVKVTPEEREALTFFTDWCDGMNPSPFLKEYQTYVEPVLKMSPREVKPY